MKLSLRARRMARNHKRLRGQPKLNLVSLMDIFTILVFFLMVNNGDVEVLQADKDIQLPDSVAEQKPDLTLMVKVSPLDIVVQGRQIVSVAEALAGDDAVIDKLEKELEYHSARSPELTDAEKEKGRSIVIMGDRSTPYVLLKRIMSTCARADYRDISLAVNSKPAEVETTGAESLGGAGNVPEAGL